MNRNSLCDVESLNKNVKMSQVLVLIVWFIFFNDSNTMISFISRHKDAVICSFKLEILFYFKFPNKIYYFSDYKIKSNFFGWYAGVQPVALQKGAEKRNFSTILF